MSKIILTSDLHFKKGLFLQVGLDYLDYMYDYASKNNITTIAFLGDILDKASKVENDVFIPLFKKIENFKDNGIEMYFLLGNHDVTSLLTNSSLLETFERFGHLINSPQTFEFGDTIINMVPFTRDEAQVLTVNADYLFTHLSICDFDFGNNRIADGEEHQAFPVSMFSNYKKVFTGHFHKRQEKYNIEYIGSPYQLNFGDAGDFNKGFVVFDTDTGKEEFVQYKLAPKFTKYNYDTLYKGILDKTITKDMLQNNLVKICIDKKVNELSKLKSVLYNNMGAVDVSIEFDTPKQDIMTDDIKVDMNVSISDMIEEFISKINTNKNGFDIVGEELLDKFRDIRG